MSIIRSSDLDYFAKPNNKDHTRLLNKDGGELGTGGHLGMVQRFEMTRDPSLIDDGSSSSHVGTVVLIGALWVNKATENVFVCVDNTPTLAVWKILGSGGGGGSLEYYDHSVYLGSIDSLDVSGDRLSGSILGSSGFIDSPPNGLTLLTTLSVTGTIVSGSNFSVVGSGLNYIKSGDNGFLEISSILFIDNNYIVVKLNGVELEKNIDAVWSSSNSIIINYDLDIGDIITIYS